MGMASQCFHLAAGRNVRCGLVVGDDQIITAAVLQPPLAPPAVPWQCLGGKGRQLAPSQAIGPTSGVSLVGGDRRRHLSPSPAFARRFITSTAISNSAWTKPIGCVHWRPVALVKPAATAPSFAGQR